MTLSDRIRALQSKWMMVLGDDAVELGKIAIDVERIERFANELIRDSPVVDLIERIDAMLFTDVENNRS